MDDPQGLMTNTYALAGSASSAAITLQTSDKNHKNFILKNTDTTYSVFVVSGETSPTAVIPASATVPVRGKMVGPGETTSYCKDPSHAFVAAIWSGVATGNLYVSVGKGP